MFVGDHGSSRGDLRRQKSESVTSTSRSIDGSLGRPWPARGIVGDLGSSKGDPRRQKDRSDPCVREERRKVGAVGDFESGEDEGRPSSVTSGSPSLWRGSWETTDMAQLSANSIGHVS